MKIGVIFTGIYMNIIKILLILIIGSSSLLYSDDFFSQDSVDEYRTIGVIADEEVDFKIEAEEVWLKYIGSATHINPRIYTFTENDITIQASGYSYVNVFGWEVSILYGSRFFLFMNDNDSYGRHGVKKIGSLYGMEFICKRGTFSKAGTFYNETLIKNITGTSFLIEGAISYSPDMLTRYLGYFSYQSRSEDTMQVFNGNAIPWVEGVDGPGIGEQLIITFSEPVNIRSTCSFKLCLLS